MISHLLLNEKELRGKIRRKEILLAGNLNLKIYGMLGCQSGKRMKKVNRVFFATESEAIENGFRPCAHCLFGKFKKWKMNAVKFTRIGLRNNY